MNFKGDFFLGHPVLWENFGTTLGLNKTLFCRDTSKCGIFCQKLLKYALRDEKNCCKCAESRLHTFSHSGEYLVTIGWAYLCLVGNIWPFSLSLHMNFHNFPYSSLLLSFKGRIPSEKMAGLHRSPGCKGFDRGRSFSRRSSEVPVGSVRPMRSGQQDLSTH